MDTKDALNSLSALAQDTRLAIFRLLVAEGQAGLPAGEIAERLGGRQNTVSTNLAILARAGLIGAEREGRVIRYRADFAAIRAFVGFLLEDCCEGRPEICAPLLGSLECLQPTKGGNRNAC